VFSVIFEVHPKPDMWDAYLDNAKMLKPELEQVEGFVDNVRYKSLTREGWVLSLSNWRDEKAVVRWRTTMRHHEVQAKGRAEIFSDYHLRVGQVTRDTHVPAGYALQEQRLDETEVGAGTTATLINAKGPQNEREMEPAARAKWMGLDSAARGLLAWDLFDAVLTPGDLILLLSWRDNDSAETWERSTSMPNAERLRRVRVVRDYGMFDRREAPQYYPEVRRASVDSA
jgi:heme-degrading monooxygenase HmoA